MANNKVVFGQEVLIDLTQDTVTPYALEEGYTAHAPSGEKIVGVMKPNKPVEVETNAEMTAISTGATEKDIGKVYLFVGEDDGVFEKDALYILVKKGTGYGFQRYAIGGSGEESTPLQEKTVEITENGTTEVLPDEGYGLSKVIVNTNVESSGSQDCDCVIDVTELPEVGVEGSVYRITTSEHTAEVYVMSGGTCLTLTKYFENTMGMSAPITARYIVVDTLPETLEGMDQETMKVAVYVIRSTGALYWDMQSTGTATLLLDDLNTMAGWSLEAKGLAESTEAITEDGTYVVITAVNSYQFFIYKNSEWRELLEEVDDFAYTLNGDGVSYAVKGNNKERFGEYNIESAHNGLPVTDVTGFGFNGYGITKLTIPDSARNIGYSAFGECASLSSINFGNGVQIIDEYAFVTCYSLLEPTLPDSVTSIGKWAFMGCKNMTTITIGSGVTSIGNGAFGSCPVLSSIVYNGTKAQWKAITKTDGWDSNTPDYIITCTDGTIAKGGTES